MMYKRMLFKSLLSLALVLPTTVSTFTPLTVQASEEETTQENEITEVVSIDTAKALLAFAQNSTNEMYTRGKCFRLTADIDISGIDFQPIAMIAGTFDGNGHTISGFTYHENGSETGLIRSVAQGGIVQHLTVVGNLFPDGLMENIGGIVGENHGIIRNCTFQGEVTARQAVGGICGHNTETGIIDGCTNTGSVIGTKRTGGVVGFNEGIVQNCLNKGSVNDRAQNAEELIDQRKKTTSDSLSEETTNEEKEDNDQDNLANLNPDNVNLFYDNVLEDVLVNKKKISYTGGIAGLSSGTVQSCTNEGVVGFSHVGYHTGGIVGYERGILTQCTNKGKIYGRKNIGGIVGEFEPYMETIYHEDSMDAARNQITGMIDQIAELQSKVKTEDDQMQSNVDAIRNNADNLRQSVKNYTDFYRDLNDNTKTEIRGRVDKIRAVINRMDSYADPSDAIEQMEDLEDSVDDLYESLDKGFNAVGQTSNPYTLLSYGVDTLGRIRDSLDDAEDVVDALVDFTKAADQDLKRLKKDLKELRSLLNELDDYLRNVTDEYQTFTRSAGDDFQNQTDVIAENMDILLDGLKSSDQVIRDQLDSIVAQLQQINSSMQSGFDEMEAEINKLKDTKSLEDIYEDISDQEEIDITLPGVISGSTNTGSINADINGGGIVGTINIDMDAQFDFDPVSEGDVSLNYDRTQKAIITECKNSASIIVKNSYAGGIVGRANMGAILRCENYGLIETKDGDYTGGIAGRSNHVVRNCYSMSSFSGNNYIGGITGLGSIVKQNIAMINIPKQDGEKLGAIAGDLDEDGSALGNIFVSKIPAINGLTYDAEAKELTYGQLQQIEGLPNAFQSLHVTFVVDDTILKDIPIPYGSSLPKDQIPQIPPQEGRFGVWEKANLTNIRHNIVVHANYIPWTTTIASSEPLPVLLLSGQFYTGTTIDYTANRTPALPKIDGYDNLASYHYKVHSQYELPGKDQQTHEIHFLANDYDSLAEVAIYNAQTDSLSLIDSKRDGKYLVFSIPVSTEATFYIVRSTWKYYLPVAGIIIGTILLLIFSVWITIRRKRNAKSQPSHRPPKRPFGKKHNA